MILENIIDFILEGTNLQELFGKEQRVFGSKTMRFHDRCMLLSPLGGFVNGGSCRYRSQPGHLAEVILGQKKRNENTLAPLTAHVIINTIDFTENEQRLLWEKNMHPEGSSFFLGEGWHTVFLRFGSSRKAHRV